MYNWQSYLDDLDTRGSGIAIKVEGESVNHGFRFIRRSDLDHYHVKGAVFDWEVDSAAQYDMTSAVSSC